MKPHNLTVEENQAPAPVQYDTDVFHDIVGQSQCTASHSHLVGIFPSLTLLLFQVSSHNFLKLLNWQILLPWVFLTVSTAIDVRRL